MDDQNQPAQDEIASGPHDEAAEMALLGSLILDATMLDAVQGLLRGATDFYSAKHQAIYTAIETIRDGAGNVDMVTLNAYLQEHGLLSDIGGVEYLITLAEGVPTASNARYYAKIVLEHAIRRQLIDTLGEIRHSAATSYDAIEDQLEAAQAAVLALSSHRRETPAQIGTLVRAVYDRLEQEHDCPAQHGFDLGFERLDAILGGLRPGQLVVLAARPSMGKTALAMSMALNAAANGTHGAFISLEMEGSALAERVLAAYSGVELSAIRRPYREMGGWDRMPLAVVRAEDLPVWVMDCPGADMSAIASVSRRIVQEHDVRLIAVDYLQLVSHKDGRSRYEKVSNISRDMKNLARQLDVTVLLMSQLNREAASGPEIPKPPGLHHLRDSGAIEEDADIVMMLHREDYYRRRIKAGAVLDGLALVSVQKNRQGATDTVKLRFEPPYTRFTDWRE